MKFGINLLLWAGELNESLLPTLESLKKMGYDGVEVPLFNLDIDYQEWGERLADMGLGSTAVTVRNLDDNPISPSADIRQSGVDETKRAVDACVALNATHLVGPYHSALGIFSGVPRTEDEWKWGVESMRKVAEHAEEAGIILGIEPLNRFECYFLNTHADAVKFVNDVDNEACRAMYDTFHANIEEKRINKAIVACTDVLCHVHVSENDRSTPGTGSVNWHYTFSALNEIKYDGWLTIEAFGQALPEIAAATKIWRSMFESEEQLAKEGLAFMKKYTRHYFKG